MSVALRPTRSVLSLLAVLAFVASACTSGTPSGSAPATPAAPQTLKVVLGAEPTSLDPSISVNKATTVIDLTYMEALAHETRDQTVGPKLARSWQQVEPTRWRLQLQQGVKFHNGELFDA